MSEKQETIDDIAADIRAQNQGLPEDAYALSPLVCDLLRLAGRIDAAHKREVGNGAKMHEALEFADKELRNATEDDRFGDDLTYLVGCMRTVAAVCRSALAEPVRNCDVGTADEQLFRFRDIWERANGERMPQVGAHLASQFSRWAQMPYENEVSDGK